MSKNILLGITGSVAASKSEILFGKVSKNNNVKIITTDAGSKYLTSEFLKNNEIISSWEDLQGSPHIELARWAEVFLIYPATANFISKMAMGIADDLLLSTVLMYNDPIYLAPAMHEEMYLNPNYCGDSYKMDESLLSSRPTILQLWFAVVQLLSVKVRLKKEQSTRRLHVLPNLRTGRKNSSFIIMESALPAQIMNLSQTIRLKPKTCRL